jgi:inorganic triphosphatase YgiF
MSQEIEIRFAAHPDDLARLAKADMLRGVAMGRAATRRLSSVYYDTKDLGFANAGLALRVRKIGRRYVQTVKNENTGTLLSERGEFECPLPSPEPDLRCVPDPDVRERLQAIASEAELAPVIETDIRRTTRSLTTETGDEVELAVDQGEIRTLADSHAVLAVNEVELELKHGQPATLYELARQLSREAPLTVAAESKAERGLRALEGRDVDTHKAGRTELAPDATAEEAFRATLAHCLKHITRNISAVADARASEGVHQLRVGLRRLRVALSAFGPGFAVQPIEELSARAKSLSDMFGETRELDVFADELLRPIEDASQKPGLPQFRLILEALRRESWENAVRLVRSDDFTGFVLDLASAIDTRIWREHIGPEQMGALMRPARELAREVLDQKLKKACKRAKHLSSLNTEERHRLRIALKKLRYSAEFFAPLFPAKAVSGFLMRLSKLQDLFGALNDAATSEHILRRVTEHAGANGTAELLEAAAFIEGWHQSRIGPTWDKAKKRWKKFAKAEPFWTA